MSVRLLLALHFHQPVGNFDSVIAEATRVCYRPVIDHFDRHPGVGAAFHFSGCLLEWLERNDRPFLDRLIRLVGSGRIEPLGGGFYEPILPVIPRPDALDQIERLASWWQTRSGVRPRGAWIAERVWEPGLAELLAEAGVAYTILDDQHLRFAGLLDPRFSGLFVTERHGRSVAFLPSDFRLRYLIPFRPIAQVRDHFGGPEFEGPEVVLTYGDDAEKFGFWPGTRAWVFDQGWLEGFLSLLEEGDRVRATSPGSFVDEKPPARKVYVPNASYTEMLEWALPATAVAAYARTRDAALKGAPEETVRAFVRGSLWDMFLSRFPEADQMHKHVLWTSARARALPSSTPGRDAAVTATLRAECNCAYWHGLFGGVYFPHLRQGVYGSLLEADAILARGDGDRPRVEVVDLDGDLEPEVVIRAGGAQAFFRPADGGTLAELDWLPARFNITNVMARWAESYHVGGDLTHAPEDRDTAGIASPHERSVGMTPADVAGGHFDDLPLRSLRDFVAARPPDPGSLSRFEGMQRLTGRLAAWEPTDRGFRGRARIGALEYGRAVAMDPDGTLVVTWSHPAGASGAEGPGSVIRGAGWFGTILCLSLLTGRAPGRRLILADGPVRGERGPAAARLEGDPQDLLVRDDTGVVVLEDGHFQVTVEVSALPAARVVTAPVETLQRSEDRHERVYQGTLIALCWALAGVAAGRGPEVRIRFRNGES